MSMGFNDLPFDIPHLLCENGEALAHVRIGWLRSVANIQHAFAIHSFIDELAVTAGIDPLTYLNRVLGPDRLLDLKAEGADYPQNMEDLMRPTLWTRLDSRRFSTPLPRVRVGGNRCPRVWGMALRCIAVF